MRGRRLSSIRILIFCSLSWQDSLMTSLTTNAEQCIQAESPGKNKTPVFNFIKKEIPAQAFSWTWSQILFP